jgi:hypothetical protein
LILDLRILPCRFRKPQPQQHPLNLLSPSQLPDRAGIPKNLRRDLLFDAGLLGRVRDQIPEKPLSIGIKQIIDVVAGYILEFISIYDILGLQRKEATAMGALQFADLQARPTEVLDLTSLTVEEFRQLVPPFETAFQAHMAAWRLDGQPRTARRYTTYKNCPLPTPEDRLLFILVYLKTYALQVVQGRLFGMGQSKAHQWIHVLLGVLQATLRGLGDAPTRSVIELAKRLGVTEAEASALVVSGQEPPSASDPLAGAPGQAPASPLLGMTAPNGASGVPRIRLSRRAVIAARKSATR